jgi:GNAT superfamily N-acetyltransferase
VALDELHAIGSLPVMADVRVEIGGAELAGPLLDPICAVYDEVFSVPPFYWREDESELHRQRLIRLLDDPTFGIALAQAGEETVGFAYGFSLPPDTKRWSSLMEPAEPTLTAEWPGRTFLLFDYAVRASRRGRGVGRRLHDALLGSRGEERATLTVQPTAIDTKRIYEHWGWWQVGRVEGGPTAAALVFDVYLRDSLDDLRAAAQATP